MKGKTENILALELKSTQIVRGTWLAQLVEHATLDLRVVGLSPTLGVEIT